MKRLQGISQPLGQVSPEKPTPAQETVMPEVPEVKPLQPIRRFDVFAETKRLEALAHGEPDDVAKGYGIRIAKIVASRRFGGSASKKTRHEQDDAPDGGASKGSRFGGEGGSKFRTLDGEI